jgi:two-component system NtrC family response regulator
VKAKSPDVDVILMTGHLDLDFAITALKKGASDYFKKPFLFDEIKHAVERAVERAASSARRASSRSCI